MKTESEMVACQF